VHKKEGTHQEDLRRSELLGNLGASITKRAPARIGSRIVFGATSLADSVSMTMMSGSRSSIVLKKSL